jgi:hypothetical protein
MSFVERWFLIFGSLRDHMKKRTGKTTPRRREYIHQRYLPFSKKFAREKEWRGRVAEIFKQNNINLLGTRSTAHSIIVELGSWKERPGGLMADYHNIQTLASHFGLRVKTEYADRSGRAEHESYFFREAGGGFVEPLKPIESNELQVFKNPRGYLRLPSKVEKRKIGRIHAVVFMDKRGRPVFTFYYYSGRENWPRQSFTNRWFVEFFSHSLVPSLAKALAERKARNTGPNYMRWLEQVHK